MAVFGPTLSPDDSEVKITWLCSYSCHLDLPEPAFPALCYMYQFIPNHKSTKLLKNVWYKMLSHILLLPTCAMGFWFTGRLFFLFLHFAHSISCFACLISCYRKRVLLLIRGYICVLKRPSSSLKIRSENSPSFSSRCSPSFSSLGTLLNWSEPLGAGIWGPLW